MRTDKGKNGLATDENAMTPEESEKTWRAIPEEDLKVYSSNGPLDPDDESAGEELRVAKEKIAELEKSEYLEDAPVLTELAFNLGLDFEKDITSIVLVPKENRNELVKLALTDYCAWRLLVLVLSRCIDSDRMPPREFRGFLSDLIKDRVEKPTSSCGSTRVRTH